MSREDFPPPTTGFVITDFLAVSDLGCSGESDKRPFDGLIVIEPTS